MLNIIVVSRHLRAAVTLSLAQGRHRWLAAAVGLGLVVAVGLAGAGIARVVMGGDAALAPLRAEVQANRQSLEQARAEARREVNAMAARLGELQAQANRLNALGQRLTEMGELKDGEFDFNERPGMGGPQADASVSPELAATLGAVESRFAAAEKQLDVLGALLENEQMARSSRPSRAPAPGYISSGFGTRADPFTGGRDHHLGVDFDANFGDPVKAAGDGIVSFSGWKNGYGNTVIVDHGDGYQTLYGHNQRNVVRVGDVVRAGQEVAKVGSTGRSTGAHLHFEVHVNGRPVNPVAYLERLRG